MYTVIILNKRSSDLMKDYKFLFKPFVDEGLIGFCDWNESGTDVKSSVPDLYNMIRGKKDWRAMVINTDSAWNYRDTPVPSRNNPFDFSASDKIETPHESPIPMVRLTHIIGGYTAVSKKEFEKGFEYFDEEEGTLVRVREADLTDEQLQQLSEDKESLNPIYIEKAVPEEVQQAEKELKKNSIKNFVISGVIFIGLIFLTFWLIFKDQDMGEVMGVVQQANLWWILGGLLLMLGYFLVQSWNVKTILGSFGEKLTLRKAFKFTLIEFFFCALTPSASGGQPVEIYYMTKEGISGSSATMAIFVQLCGYQISVVLLGIIAVLFLPYKIPSGVHMFFTIGLLINVAALVILLTCVFSQKVSQVAVKWVIKLARRLKYKKVDQMQQRLEEGLEQYAKSAKYIKENL